MNRQIVFLCRRICNRGLHTTCIRSSESTVRQHPTSNFDKRVLVAVKKYDNIAAVPDIIPATVMISARDRFRVKMMWYIIAATLVASLGMVISGKRAAGRGESVEKGNLDWHKKHNEK